MSDFKSSIKKIKPKCEYFGECGGCDLQDLSYQDQLEYKKKWLKDLFQKQQILKGCALREIVPCESPYYYRNRITLHQKGKAFGYFRSRSHEIVSINECVIASKEVNLKLSQLSSDKLEGKEKFEIREDETSGFVQVNKFQNQNLINLVLNYAQGKKWKNTLDLYSGSGNFSFPLSNIAKKILAIDNDEEAVKEAENIRQELGNKKIKFVCDAVLTQVSDFANEFKEFDLVVCDPPREGLGKAANYVTRLKPQRIVYVSCHPPSFIRDANVLIDKGYELQEVTPIDMFPQTRHLEIVGMFSVPRA